MNMEAINLNIPIGIAVLGVLVVAIVAFAITYYFHKKFPDLC